MSVEIGDSVTSIGYYAFETCFSLTLYCKAESKPDAWDSTWNPNNQPVVWGFANNFIAVNNKIGDISTALDLIIAQTNSIIGGNS
jgi:hypothetical protein